MRFLNGRHLPLTRCKTFLGVFLFKSYDSVGLSGRFSELRNLREVDLRYPSDALLQKCSRK